ncbi:cytochrome c [Aureibaculum algae]|uniref:Cytochrome c n=1 Tax=Aureibaculum algae TaxID=2584122 RepID=A0A5B7TWB5_9FLAO|nr:cytochrome c [Aureibaculum algae]QCX39396.1 cytochrome c [Aureibaculum algae]
MKKVILSVFVLSLAVLVSCGDKTKKDSTEAPKEEVVKEEVVEVDPMQNKGIGPITSVTLAAEVDQELAKTGKEVYEKMCTACHKAEKKFIGPAPKGILERRSPEWVMNMILNPDGMVKEDPIAKALLAEYLSPMSNQNLTEEQARAVLEYFRTL